MNYKQEINRKQQPGNTTRVATLRISCSRVLVLTAALLIGGSRFGFAGPLPVTPQGLEPAKVAATIQANAQALKQFTYQQRLQLQLKGETKKVTLNQVNYDPNGNEVKTLLSEQPSADQQPTGGRLKERIVAKKKGEFKDMMDSIAALVKSYTEIPHDQLQAALKQASFSMGTGDMQGAIQIEMKNVNQPGDSFTVWIDKQAMLFRRAVIATTYEGNPVTTNANYSILPSGQVYMAQAILNYPKKEVVVQVNNMNYQRL